MPDPRPANFYRYFPVAKRDRDWGLFVTTIGESRIRAGSAYPPAGHPKGYDFRASEGRRLEEFQIIYISAGGGRLRTQSRGPVKVNAGQLIFLFPRVWHSYAPEPGTGWTEHWVGFNGDWPHRLAQRRFFKAHPPILRAGEEDTLLALFTDMVEATRNNHPALQQILAATTMRILALLYSVQQSKLAGDDPGLQVIHKAINRMRAPETGSLSLPELSRELKVSYRWFRWAFAHHTGLSPHQYFLEMRLARARVLLAQTSLTTKEVASRTGFEDPHYFSRIFHRKVGMPPALWRARVSKGSTGRDTQKKALASSSL